MNTSRQTIQIKSLVYFLLLTLFFLGIGCAGKLPQIKDTKTETLIEDYPPGGRPKWSYENPFIKGEYLLFIGQSGKFSAENYTTDDAVGHACAEVAKYLSNVSLSVFKKRSFSQALASQGADPDEVILGIRESFSNNIISQVVWIKRYVEKLGTPYGIRYKAFVQARVPKTVIEEALENNEYLNDDFLKRVKEELWNEIKSRGRLPEEK